MYKEEVNLEIDDYLDLFIIAGKLNDQEWQQEISMKLQNYHNSNDNKVDVADHDNSVECIDAIHDNYDDDDYDFPQHLFSWN